MASPTFNAGADLFGIAVENVVEVTAENENKSAQSAEGTNTYGDVINVDQYGETSTPSCDYKVVGEWTTFAKNIGAVTDGIVFSGISINTSSTSAPTVTANGTKVQSGAVQLRKYVLPSFTVTPRHRAQDIFGILSVKVGASEADDATDYGLSSANYSANGTVTLGDPKGVVKSYDIHGAALEASFTVDWYASTAPTIDLNATAKSAGWIISSPVTRSCPENGYTQYTFSARRNLIGEEIE